MTLPAPPATASRAPLATSPPCRRCGGSGILRLADGRFRTCLDCLGLGLQPAPAAGTVGPRPGGSAHARSLRSPDEESSRSHDRGQGCGGQQQEKHGGPVCVHPCG
ncbi:MAG: hypothetical protein ACK59A_07355 [Cyanobacteriota bacterium]